MGAAAGAQWLCAEHPESVRCDYVAQRGRRRRVRARRAALLHALRRREGRLPLPGPDARPRRPRLGPGARRQRAAQAGAAARAAAPTAARSSRRPRAIAFLGALLRRGPRRRRPRRARGRRRAAARPRRREVAAYLAEPMLRVTLVPTRAAASEKDNVIPSQAEILVDCRVPPGMDGGRGPRAGRGASRRRGGSGARGGVHRTVVGNRSPPHSPLAEAIEAWLGSTTPARPLVPIVMAGFSDSHWFRRAFDAATVYGFCPQRELVAARGAPADPQRRRARRRRATSSSRRASTRHHPAGAGVSPSENGASAEHVVDAPGNGGRPEPPLRLGGMALRNGLLIHGPTSWAAAARAARRRDRGRVGPEADASPAGRSARLPLLRGPLRLAEAFAVIPIARRGLPSARLPFEDPRVLAVGARHGGAQRRLIRRLRPGDRRAARPLIAALGVLPAADRAARPRPGRLPRGRAQGDRRLRARQLDPADAPKEHERCGSNLIAPAAGALGGRPAVVERLVRESGAAARGAGRDRPASRRRSRCSPTPSARRIPPLGRAIHAAGHEIQRARLDPRADRGAARGRRRPPSQEILTGRDAATRLVQARPEPADTFRRTP